MILPGFARDWTGVTILIKRNTSICLTVLTLELNV